MSPELPKLSELLALHQPKDNEILLVGGQEASPAQVGVRLSVCPSVSPSVRLHLKDARMKVQ